MKFLVVLFAFIAAVSAFAPRASRVVTKALVSFLLNLFEGFLVEILIKC